MRGAIFSKLLFLPNWKISKREKLAINRNNNTVLSLNEMNLSRLAPLRVYSKSCIDHARWWLHRGVRGAGAPVPLYLPFPYGSRSKSGVGHEPRCLIEVSDYVCRSLGAAVSMCLHWTVIKKGCLRGNVRWRLGSKPSR